MPISGLKVRRGSHRRTALYPAALAALFLERGTTELLSPSTLATAAATAATGASAATGTGASAATTRRPRGCCARFITAAGVAFVAVLIEIAAVRNGRLIIATVVW